MDSPLNRKSNIQYIYRDKECHLVEVSVLKDRELIGSGILDTLEGKLVSFREKKE